MLSSDGHGKGSHQLGGLSGSMLSRDSRRTISRGRKMKIASINIFAFGCCFSCKKGGKKKRKNNLLIFVVDDKSVSSLMTMRGNGC